MNVVAINAMLAGLVSLLGEGARFVACEGVKPVDGGPLTTVVAVAELALPSGTISDGLLRLVQKNAEGDMATATGIPNWGRIELADGTWIDDFTVSGPSGAGQVKITIENPQPGDPEGKVYQGGLFFLSEVDIGGE